MVAGASAVICEAYPDANVRSLGTSKILLRRRSRGVAEEARNRLRYRPGSAPTQEEDETKDARTGTTPANHRSSRESQHDATAAGERAG